MFENNLHEVISAYVPHFSEKYDGNSSLDNQRNGHGYQEWKNDDFQKYSGEFLQDSLHGNGKYTWLRPSQSYMYEGGLYANNFEGYANLIRTDGQYFEGLLKNNRRFGPGVVTYPDGKQDVGLWDGSILRRLSCVVMPEWVPRLARTSTGKIKLLKFRKLVPICPIETDGAKEILRELGANSEVLQKSDELYNKFIRHPKSKLFNKKLHDEKFLGQIDCTIEVADPEAGFDNVSISSVNKDAVDEIFEILLENVDILKDVPNEQRREIVAGKLEEMRLDYYIHSSEIFVKSLLETLLENTDEMLKYPKEERVLIFNRIMIQNLLRSPKIKNDFPTKKIEISELLAWNNENISIEMMKHIFLCRNLENMVSFGVTKLLAGDRTSFNACGNHEKICVLFLINCSVGNDEIVENIFLNYGLNQDLCDARGNAGITFAAARDRWSIIRKLTNVGVNVDVLNDEGLTPLVLCLLRYLAIKKSVGNWESAFLTNTIVKPEEELKVTTEWRPHVSLSDLNQVSVTTLYETYADLKDGFEKLNLINKPNPFIISECNDLPIDSLKDVFDEIKSMEVDMAFRNFQEPYTDINEPNTQTYIFKTSCKVPSTKTKKKAKAKIKAKAKAKVKAKTKTKKLKSPKPKESDSTAKEFIMTNKLKVVFTTIKMLLSCGADPNIGQAPMPPLIICLFCGNEELLNLLLASSADPNIVTMDENLAPLHILAMLPFSKENAAMFRILLEHAADPNCKANTYHWMEQKTKIIGKHKPEGEDLGKTPLHILCMRYDFNDDTDDYLPQMIKHLIDFKANVRDYYLGHTPFSLAVLRGNLKLIKFFLDTTTADPNEKLGEGMGVALTVPILKRYAKALPLQTAMDVYDLLMEYYVNPLRDVDEMGNAIEFMYREHQTEKKPKIKKKKRRKKSGKTSSKSSKTSSKRSKTSSKRSKTSSKRSKTSSKRSKTSSKRSKKKSASTDEIRNYLLQCARKMLHRQVQYNAFKHLAHFVLENADLEDEVSNTLVKFLTLSDAERIIQILLRKRIFRPNDTTYYISLRILERIKAVKIHSKKGKTKKNKGDRRTPEDILENLDFDTIDPVNKFGLIEPEVDPNKSRFVVCFYCGRKVGKILIACPKCGLVYFCSEECNKLCNKKQANLHKCRVLFYNKEKKKQEEFSALGLTYEFHSQLDDKLNEIKHDNLLRYLGRGGRGDGFDIDFEQGFDLSDIGKGKFTFSTGQGVKRRSIPRSAWSSRETYLQEEGRKKMADERLEKRGKGKQGSRAVSPGKGTRRKHGGTWSEEDTEVRKHKGRKARTKEDAKFKQGSRAVLPGKGIRRKYEDTWSEEDTEERKHKGRKARTKEDAKFKQGSRAVSPGKGTRRKYEDTWSEEDIEERKHKDRKVRTKEDAKFKHRDGESPVEEDAKSKRKDREVRTEKDKSGKQQEKRKGKSGLKVKDRGSWSEERVLGKDKESKKGKFEGRAKKIGEIWSEESELDKHKGSKKSKIQGKTKGKGTWSETSEVGKHKESKKGKPERKMEDRETWSEESVSGKHKESKRGKFEGKVKDRGPLSKRDSSSKLKGVRKGEYEGKMKEYEGKMKNIEERTKRNMLTKDKGSIRGKSDEKLKDKGVRIKKDVPAKGTFNKKSKSEERISEKRTVMKAKNVKDREKGVTGVERGPLSYGSRDLGQGTSVKREGKFDTGRKLEYARDTEIEMDKSKMQPSLIGFPYRKGQEHGDIATYAYSKLSKKYQHFLEILSEFFPDFDLCMLLLPYACFVDGQLYYRFLDERPSFCLSFSNI